MACCNAETAEGKGGDKLFAEMDAIVNSIEAIKRLDVLLEYAVMHGMSAISVHNR